MAPRVRLFAGLSYQGRIALAGFLFVLPALLHLIIFSIFPMLNALRYSFTQFDLLNPPIWVGVKNYVDLFTDPNFWHSVQVTLVYIGGVTVAVLWLSLGLGLALSSRIPGIALFRAIYFLPWVTALVGLAVTWRLMYHTYGAWNDLLVRLGGSAIPWLIHSRYALLAIVLFTIWRSVGYFAVMYLVGIQAIPRDYLEAARIDGASPLQLFGSVLWPLLKPTTVFVLIISITSTMRHIDTFFLMTGGGPADATRVLALLIYQEGFAYLKMGRASAVSMIMLATVMILTLMQLRLFRREEHEL